jgi:hypothetical protein
MDENLENTSFAIISELQGNPIKGGGGKVIALYGVREITPKRIVGTYVESTFAQAPFPISIEFRGSFTLLRLEDFTNKDLAYRLKEARGKQAERPPMDVPLAPDLPAVLPPKEKNPPPVTD